MQVIEEVNHASGEVANSAETLNHFSEEFNKQP